MQQGGRKLVGLFLLLILLFIYPAIASLIYEKFLLGAELWLLIIYFAIAGLLWAIPAGIVIKWMLKPKK